MPVVSKQKASAPQTPIKNGPTMAGLAMKTSLMSNDEESVWSMERVPILIYGVSGTGKTRTAATFPGPILWLLCSGGGRPGELKSVNTVENRKKITPRVVRSTDQMKEYRKQARDYQTVVLDHASGLADLVLKEILGLEEIPAQKTWGMATRSQYGQLVVQCKEYFRALLNLPGNPVFIAQERIFGGKEDGGDPEIIKPSIGPALTPSLAGWLCPACDFVAQTFKRPRMVEVVDEVAGKKIKTMERVKGVDYCLRTEEHDLYITKFRVPPGQELPDAIVNPSYEKIVKVIKGE